MSKSNVVEFRAKFIADVSDITSNVKDIQQEINKLSLPDNFKTQFAKVFTNLEKNAEKAQKIMTAGFKTKGDVAAYQKTMNLIVGDMEKIGMLMNKVDTSKLDFQVDAKKIKAFSDEIERLQKLIDGLKSQKLEDVQKIASERADTSKNAAAWTEFFEAFKKGAEGVDDAEKAIKKLRTQVKRAIEKAGGEENLSEKWKIYAEQVKLYDAALEELKGNTAEIIALEQEQAEVIAKRDALQENANTAGAKSFEDMKDEVKNCTEGVKTFGKESGEAAENTQQLSSSLDSFKNKAAYFFGLSNAVNLFKRAVRSAFETVKELDAVMTETAVVTDFSVGDMWDQLPEYTQRANELGVSIHDAYKAATLYYQQGLKTNEVMAVSNETLKMARIAGLDAAEATSRMTNALRGFNMEINEDSAQRVNDVYSKLAAITASDTNEISTAMTKVASLAHNANMEFETTSAFLAQMIETTRESAETAGTALKTVIARFSEVKKLYSEGDLMGTDEEGEEIDVNKVSTALRSAGINMNEYLTGAKGLDDIFIELASKWDSLDMIQQRYIATMAAGSRQQSRFIAMMSDYKRTMELVGAANTSAGASQKQFEKTLESLQSKLAQLSNSWKTFLMGIADNAIIKTVIDLLTNLLDTINKLFDGLDGLPGSIARIGASLATLKLGHTILKQVFPEITDWIGKFRKKGEEAGGEFANGVGAEATKGFKKIFDGQYWTEAWSFTGTFGKYGDEFKKQIDLMDEESKRLLEDIGVGSSLVEDQIEQEIIASTSLNAVRNSGLTAVEKELLYKKLLTDETYREWVATEGLEAILEDENFQKERAEMLSKRNIVSILAETTAQTFQGKAVGKTTLYLWLQKKQQKKNIITTKLFALMTKFSSTSMLLFAGATLLAVAAIAALVAGLYFGIKALMNWYHSEEIAQEKAQETAESTKKAVDETTEAYNNLKSSVDELTEKYESIENLTRGTQEWRDAVNEVNDKVLELISNYKGLEVVEENGVLKITNLDEVQDQLYNNKINAQVAQLAANKAEARANIRVANKGLAEAYVADRREELIGSARGWTFPWEEYGGNFESEAKEWKSSIDENTKVLEQNDKALAALVISNAELKEGTEKQASTYLTDSRMSRFYESAMAEIDKEDLSFSDLKERIAQESGYTNYNKYEEANGKITSEDSAREIYAQIKASQKATTAVEKFSVEIKRLPTEIQKIYSRDDFAGLAQEDIDKLRGTSENILQAATQFGTKQWDKMSLEEKELYGGNTEEARQNYINNIKADWVKAEIASREGIRQASEKMSNFVGTEIGSVFSKLSGGVANDLANNFSEIFRMSGAAGVKNIQDEINKLTEGMDSEQADKFVGIINSLNWENLDEAESLQDYVDELGFANKDVSDLTDKIIEFAKAARNVDLEKLTEEVQGMASLAANIRKGEQKSTGWSKENVQNAIAAGASMTDFVINVEDGSYTYVGEKLDDIYTLLVEKLDEKINVAEIRKRVQDANIIKDLARSGNLETRNGQENFLRGVYASTSGIISTDQKNALQFMSDKEISDLVAKVQENTKGLEADEQALWDLKVTELALNNTNKELAQKAGEGDNAALAALQGNARVSGMSDQLYNANKDDPNALNAITSIFEEAQSLDIDADELSDYIKNLKKAHRGLSDVAAAQIALANTKYINGLKKIIDSYDSWTKLLKEDGTLMTDLDKDSAKIIEDFKDAASEMLGVELSDNFFYGPEAEKNIALLKQLTEQGEDATEALRQLEIQAAKDYAISLGLNENDIDKVLNYVSDSLLESEDWLKLEIGASIDDAQFTNGLVTMMNNLGLSIDQMNAMFDTLGFSLEQVPVKYTYSGIYLPNGQQVSTIATPIEWKYVVRKNKNARSPNFTPPKSSGGGGGSGSSKEEKPDYWENPFDELYNLQEKINEALRTREALERKYQKLLKQTASNLSEVTKAYYDQITHLREEANLQQQMQEGRARQLNNIGNEIYTDSEGNRATFASLGVMKYASYDQNTGVITIDWPALEEIASDPSRTAEGEAAEAYIKRLEELSQQFEEVRDKLWDIEDQIETLQQEAIDSYLTFEDRVMEALKNQYQQEIDDFKALSDTIKNATDEIIDGIQDDVELARQIRDNTKKEEDIAEKEARLAYLRRDTSGANDLEIKKLEKELEQEREDYSDTLVDQQIAQMQKDAEDAAKQREKQIELMQHALDMAIENGELWEEVYGLIASSVDPQTGVVVDESPLMDLLRSQEAFGSLSKIGQEKWWEDTVAAIKEALVGLGVAEDHYNIGDEDRRTGTSISTFMDRLYEQILGRNADEAGKEYWSELIQSGKMSRADVIKSFLGSEEFRNRNLGNEDFIEALYQSFFGRAADKEGKEYWVNQLKSGARSRDDIINEFFNSLEWTNSLLPRKSEEQGPTMGAKKPTGTSYSSGALPELVLDAKDTENFIALRDVLANLLGTEGAAAMKTNGGDTYFDINIDAEIGSDYDVDKLAEQIEKKIYNLGSYRNANVIRGLR